MTVDTVPGAGWREVYRALNVGADFKCVDDYGVHLRGLRDGLYRCVRCGIEIEQSPGGGLQRTSSAGHLTGDTPDRSMVALHHDARSFTSPRYVGTSYRVKKPLRTQRPENARGLSTPCPVPAFSVADDNKRCSNSCSAGSIPFAGCRPSPYTCMLNTRQSERIDGRRIRGGGHR